jgi:biotin carboxyl carrier protein
MDNGEEFYHLIIDDTPYEVRLTPKFLKRKPYIPADPKKVKAVIPGIIRNIFVKKGQKIKRGDNLLILEAMKMKNFVKSSKDGLIKTVYIKTGEMVVKDQLLIEFE